MNRKILAVSAALATLALSVAFQAQAAPADPQSYAPVARPTTDPNRYPNPYKTELEYLKLPPGRTMGSSSSVAVDHEGHIWVAERCGANDCAGSKIDPIVEFAADGKFIKAFGAGMILFPHGFYIDAKDHIWITDGHAAGGKGFQAMEFDTDGKLLRALGKPGGGQGPSDFNQPSGVLVAPNGDIFVADGHDPQKGHARVVKFGPDGHFIKQWGGHGSKPGQFETPHTLAMDSSGRLFVGDRWNNRIQIFDQDGKLLGVWTQFGRPSGIFIDKHDVLYVSDSESHEKRAYGYHPGWKRGIRVGSAKTGAVTAFIPDTYPTPETSSTSGAEGITADDHGVIYGAQVQQKAIVRYVKK